MPTWDSGTSFQAPTRSPRGSETTTRVSSDSARELLALRVQGLQVIHSRTEVERSRRTLARVAERIDATPVGRRDRHLDGMLDAVLTSGFLDEADHPLDGGDRVALEPEGEGEVEHRLRVGGALDRGEERVVDREHQLASQQWELADQPVVHPQPAAVAERVRVGLLDRRSRGGADVGEEEVRRDPGGELAQVLVVPRGMDAAVEPRCVAVVVPADAEAVPVRRRRTQSGVQALVDQRAVTLEQQLLEPDRRSRVRKPTTHRLLLPGSRRDGLGRTAHRNDPSVFQSQLSNRSRPPSGGTPRCERAMSGSNSRSSSSSAVSALRASIMISLFR